MLGEVLVEKKIIDEKQLNEALNVQAKDKELLGQILVKLGHCFEEDIARALLLNDTCHLDKLANN